MEESWDPIAKSEKSETFCILPWVHQYIGAQGDVKPCCIYQHKYELGNLKKNSLEEIFNNEETKKLRLDMLNGVKRPECKECTLKEGVLRSTLRNSMNSRFTHKSLKQSLDVLNQLKSTQPDGTVSTHKLFYMDVRFNNLCNFKCMTCSPVFSSSLIEEFNLVYNTKYGYSFAGKTEEDVFEQMRPHIPNLTNIYFAGGEPMMQKEHYQTLIECIEVQNFPDLSYNTNLSRLSLGKYDVIQLWKYFPRVAVMASLDGNYERAEYWRKETNWNKILENRYRIKNEAPNVGFVVACTVTWVNIFNILDFHKEWYELGLVDLDKFNLNPTYGPEFYSLVGLPKWKKNRVCHAINNHIDWIQAQNYNKKGINLQVENATKTFQGLLKFVNEDAPELDAYQFHRVVSKFDGMRNNSKSFFEVFTEHKDMEEYFNSKGYFFEKNLT